MSSALKRLWQNPLYWLLILGVCMIVFSEVWPVIIMFDKPVADEAYVDVHLSYISNELLQKSDLSSLCLISKTGCIAVQQRIFFMNINKVFYLDETQREWLAAFLQEEASQVEKQRQASQVLEQIYQELIPQNRWYVHYYPLRFYQMSGLEITHQALIEFYDNIFQDFSFSTYLSIFYTDIFQTAVALLTILFVAVTLPNDRRKLKKYLFAWIVSMIIIYLASFIIFWLKARGNSQLLQWGLQFKDIILPLIIGYIPTLMYVTALAIFLKTVIRRVLPSIILYIVYFSSVMDLDHINFSSFLVRWNHNPYKAYLQDLQVQLPTIIFNRGIYLVLAFFMIGITLKILKKRELA